MAVSCWWPFWDTMSGKSSKDPQRVASKDPQRVAKGDSWQGTLKFRSHSCHEPVGQPGTGSRQRYSDPSPISRDRKQQRSGNSTPIFRGGRQLFSLFLTPPDSGTSRRSAATMLWFTPAEGRLAMVLLEGHSLKEAADSSGVTYNTIKSQLKIIFLKTNVQR